MNRYKSLLTLAIVAIALVASYSSARAQPEPMNLKKSWLVPGACPYCDWGAKCGCTPQ